MLCIVVFILKVNNITLTFSNNIRLRDLFVSRNLHLILVLRLGLIFRMLCMQLSHFGRFCWNSCICIFVEYVASKWNTVGNKVWMVHFSYWWCEINETYQLSTVTAKMYLFCLLQKWCSAPNSCTTILWIFNNVIFLIKQ